MKKSILILFLLLSPFINIYAQDPGFGEEGGGEAQTAPVPIDKDVQNGIYAGILIAGFFFYSRKRKTA